MELCKRKIKLVVLLGVTLLLISVIPRIVYAADSDNFKYSEIENGIEVTGYYGNDTSLAIPQQIYGKDVLGISQDAFADMTSIESIVIPNTVTYIGEKAFSNCNKLSMVRFLGDAPAIGEQSFVNCDLNLKIYYDPGKNGFTDNINGYPTIPYIAVTGIKLNKTTLSLIVGESVSLKSTLTPNNATNKNISWASSNPEVATVDQSGKVTLIKQGTTTISVTSQEGGYTATCEINTVNLPSVPSGDFAVAQSYSSIKVLWNKVPDAMSYVIYKSSTKNGTYTQLAKDIKSLYFEDSGLKTGTTYYYKVRAYNTTTKKLSAYTQPITGKTLDGTINSKLFMYMSNLKNRNSVYTRAVKLHNGNPKNTCAYTASEALRRIGLDIPDWTCRTEQVERNIKARGWKIEMDLSLLQPGDIAFTTDSKGNLLGGHSTHTFIFMSWANKEKTLMNICDNQVGTYGGVYHTRTILKSKLTDATAFFYRTTLTDVSTILKVNPKMTVKSTAYNKVELSWGNATSAYGYKVYRSTSKYGTYTNIATTKNKKYIDTTVVPGKTYYYKIRPYSTEVNITAYGNYTNIYSAKTSVVAPKASISSTSKGTVKLSWKAVSGANGYEVYRATSKTGSYKKLTTISKTAYSNTKLSSKKTYYYKVRAYRLVGKTKVYSGYTFMNIKVK